MTHRQKRMAGGFLFCPSKCEHRRKIAMSEAVGDQAGRPSEPSPSLVMKFGGTSVEDVVAIRRAAQIVRQRLRHRPVVVVSALSDVTDQLLEAGRKAAAGQLQL